ncbi:TetR/AcrR family transcriptional regulator [Paenibacillus sp. HWE-109]|uniref:TetR/AcrR family transcriptional regulator n=1 Tax=Paenibacillus sp. HWE-109 TaxID=1306526 RepID=UPI001EDCC6BF|nr:TetR/AcrR family transcriptional regulator [Paenibacillus sp. HWE-109]UKS25413.1 TetR/AcrR family transcriptional regulator [Paenibacillus sp. HWE-109]
MNIDRFERLPQQKKENIFQACLSEFATYGFDAASTNRIVKEAGIPKGSLFQYFGDKESLFLYVYRRVRQEKEQHLKDSSKDMPSDFLEAVLQILVINLEFFKIRPTCAQFMSVVARLRMHPLHHKIQEIGQQEDFRNNRKILSALPRDQIRDDIDLEDVLQLISALAGPLDQRIEELVVANDGNLDVIYQGITEIVQDFRKFFTILRHGIYKK